jgi:hypothetical protein
MVAMLLALLAAGVAAGAGWWLAARARDQALADLRASHAEAAQLRTAVARQNLAVQQMASATALARARGRQAQARADATQQRYEAAQRGLEGARAANCAQAMPYVDQLLERIR